MIKCWSSAWLVTACSANLHHTSVGANFSVPSPRQHDVATQALRSVGLRPATVYGKAAVPHTSAGDINYGGSQMISLQGLHCVWQTILCSESSHPVTVFAKARRPLPT